MTVQPSWSCLMLCILQPRHSSRLPSHKMQRLTEYKCIFRAEVCLYRFCIVANHAQHAHWKNYWLVNGHPSLYCLSPLYLSYCCALHHHQLEASWCLHVSHHATLLHLFCCESVLIVVGRTYCQFSCIKWIIVCLRHLLKVCNTFDWHCNA